MQLELFPKPYDEEIEDLKERYDRLRKSQHARITGLQKEIKELKTELEFLKANICKGLIL
jgi:peptidoglycan hydrolase CwlO-like protein